MPETIEAPVIPYTNPAKGRPQELPKTKRQPPFNVILLNDDDHTVNYVVQMMQQIFGYLPQKGVLIAQEVHEKGRCIVYTGTFEVAEFKQDQIHSFGPDPQVPSCAGSMTCVLEPAA